jgi:transcriptional regulator with XRE-family HTH domain
MSLQDNLRTLRERAGYTQAKDFAENVLKMSYSTYMGYETRGTWPNEETLINIAKALHTTIDELLGFNPNRLTAIISLLKKCGYDIKDKGTSLEIDGTKISKKACIALYDYILQRSTANEDRFKKELIENFFHPVLRYFSLLSEYQSILTLAVTIKDKLTDKEQEALNKTATMVYENLIDVEYLLREKGAITKEFPSLFSKKQFAIMQKQIENVLKRKQDTERSADKE